jgi:hypothetical protein
MLTAAVFAPLTPDPNLILSYINQYHLPSNIAFNLGQISELQAHS